jgi:hypothetical protein
MNKNREDNNLRGLKHKKVRMIQTKQFTKKKYTNNGTTYCKITLIHNCK